MEALTAWSADRPMRHPDLVPGGNAIAFGTGFGDSGYPTWIGRTPTGRVGCFIIDMPMLATSPSATPWQPPD